MKREEEKKKSIGIITPFVETFPIYNWVGSKIGYKFLERAAIKSV